MKKAIVLLLIVLTFSCNSQDALPPNTYEITVTAKGVVNGLRSHIKTINDRRSENVLDTAIVMNETFTFTGNIESPALKLLSVNGVKGNLSFVLEPGRTSIELFKDSIHASKISGTTNNEAYNAYKAYYKEKSEIISETRNSAIAARRNGETSLFEELRTKDLELGKALNDYVHEFVAEQPKSDLSLLLLESQANGNNKDIEKFKNSVLTLQHVINKNDANKLIGQKVTTFITIAEAKGNTEIGKIAPNFSAPKPDGDILALNDIKGKATIIDFWASWCKPCRRENPNVVKVYEKYHDKGLEIISVSLDRNGQKERWLKAIDDDNMNWHHVSNLKFWNEPVARLYNVSGIPATFILDEDGKIVAKKLRGDALEAQIAQMLD